MVLILAEELSKLQESVPITSYDEVKQITEKEFQKPIDEIYDEFAIELIASASIGQVHKVILDNKFVAVKVQYPNIKETIASDIQIINTIVTRLDNNIAMTKVYRCFWKDIHKELDYKFEAINAIYLRDLLYDDEVYIPEIYVEYSTDKVLTMEYLDGLVLIKYYLILRMCMIKKKSQE